MNILETSSSSSEDEVDVVVRRRKIYKNRATLHEAEVEVVVGEPLVLGTNNQNVECEGSQTLKATSLKRKVDSDWGHYVPRKQKEPISRKLRTVVPNPLNTVKTECYAIKLQYLKEEAKAQRQGFELAQRQEERAIEKHAQEMKKLALEIKKLENEI